MSTFKQSTACCSVPPINPKEISYQPKGKYEEIAGIRTYVAGDDAINPPKHCLLVVYDIFAFHPNTLQGADILSSSGSRPYLVLMPDFFEGEVAKWEWYPDDTPEKTEKLEGFLNGPGNTEKTVEKVLRLQKKASAKFSTVEKWGILGYCWGGWIASYSSLSPNTPFSAVQLLHSDFVGKEIAQQIKIPILVLTSKDESEDDVKRFTDELGTDSKHIDHKMFSNMVHGWLSARGDLKNEEVRKAYEEGYSMMLGFFGKWL